MAWPGVSGKNTLGIFYSRLVYRYYVALLQKDGSNVSVKRKHDGSGNDQASSGLRQDLLVKAVSKAERELPQAGRVDDKMKQSVAKQLQEERDQRDQKEVAQAHKVWEDPRIRFGAGLIDTISNAYMYI
jgi:hypothetical protein